MGLFALLDRGRYGIRGAPSEETPSAARTLIVMAAWAAARVRARSRRKGRLLELGGGVPWKIPVVSCNL